MIGRIKDKSYPEMIVSIIIGCIVGGIFLGVLNIILQTLPNPPITMSSIQIIITFIIATTLTTLADALDLFSKLQNKL